jgi:hypothetical protein
MSKNEKTLIIYAYYEKNYEYIKNLEFFLKFGLYDDIDYIFCIANKTCSIQIPSLPNIKIILRDNIGYDFGAYADALETIDINLYNNFFFINTSVRGPFLPKELRSTTRWTDHFLKLLTNDTKLVGTTINIYNITDPDDQIYRHLNLLTEKGYTAPFPHVQTQLFAIDNEALQYIISSGFFNKPMETNYYKFIALYEVLLSQLILKKNWNINCILPKYKDLDYRTLTYDINPSNLNGDPGCHNSYFGGTIEPYDVIFIKTNRNISTPIVMSLTDEYENTN